MRVQRLYDSTVALLLTAALVGVGGWLLARGNPDPGAFVAAGERLLGRHGLSVFDNAYLQVGPLYLLVEGLVATPARCLGANPELVLSVLWCVVLLVWTRWVARAVHPAGRDHVSPLQPWALAVGAVFVLPLVAAAGHFEEAATGLALLSAGVLMERDRSGAAGVLLAAATAIKAWGVLGLPLILLARGRRDRFIVAGVALAGSAASYAPFLLTGHVATAEHAWQVAVPSAVSLVVAPGTLFGLSARLVQLIAAGAAGAAVAWRRRGQPLGAAFAVLAVTLAARLLTDPYPQSYYVAPLLLIVAFALLAMRPAGVRAEIELIGVAIALDVAFAAPGVVGSVLQLAACLALVGPGLVGGRGVVRLGESPRWSRLRLKY